MYIRCEVQLATEDSFTYSPDEVAELVLTALNGDPMKDSAVVAITMPTAMGTAGTPATPPTMPTP